MSIGVNLSIVLSGVLVFAVLTPNVPVAVAVAAEAAERSESAKDDGESAEVEKEFRGLLRSPLLFVKRHSYQGIHIYDTCYKWPPGGGGIYVLENPAAPRSEWLIRPVIDSTTPGTLGLGVYNDPELSWDAQKLLFCFKGSPDGNTSIYEIGVDGKGLRRLTDPSPTCLSYQGAHSGQHDLAPAYLPDGRIVFLSTRPSGLVPCANEGVAILHVMNSDGSDIHPISVNNVNEFDPAVLPDGRILFGRWEYVDKTALTQQSLWTINPDGTGETALFANNLVFPEAILDARPVPGSHRIVGAFTPHNAPPRGSIALIDPRLGKNNLDAIDNLEHPENPAYDRGNSCEPWAVSEDVVIFSGRPKNRARNVLEMVDTEGRRIEVLSDPDICLHSPMLVEPRPVPTVRSDVADRAASTGRFFVRDIYQGLGGVERGEVKWLRVIEETSRVSSSPGGQNPYNQTFLVSGALAFSVKNFLGLVPVEADGSVYFEAPSGRALYLQALDGDHRLIQSMRTFIQAAPGVTRSCVGCHEHKASTAANLGLPGVLRREPRRLQPEQWGSGYLDYPSMIQPVLDRHCVRCHGGREDIAGGLDLTGGWTEHFNISYENLTSRRETQLTAYWIAGIDCMNGTAHWSAQILPPRSHGSGVAPLADLILQGHEDRIPALSHKERDLLFAWIDSNGLYHGTWDYTEHGCAITEWSRVKRALIREMKSAGCVRCHGEEKMVFESDWFNLKEPELSRILRAPLARGSDGFGLGLCRERVVDPARQRVRLLREKYEHAVKPLEEFARQPVPALDLSGDPLVSLVSTTDSRYQAMLRIIRDGRDRALLAPRIDMPGAVVVAGSCRQFSSPHLPEVAPRLETRIDDDGVVELAWERSAWTIGLAAELHRSKQQDFTPDESTLVTRTSLFSYADRMASAGPQHYALALVSFDQRSRPAFATVSVPPALPPEAPDGLTALPAPGSVHLRWSPVPGRFLTYQVYRAEIGAGEFEKVTPGPIQAATFTDVTAEPRVEYAYAVSATSRRGLESEWSSVATARARLVEAPVFSADFSDDLISLFRESELLAGWSHGAARCDGLALDLLEGGHVTFPHQPEFDLSQPLAVECWVRLDAAGKSPVIVSCGEWRKTGWFLQRLGGNWRWHVGGVDCDGGKPVVGQWTHLAAVVDGPTARLYENGKLVAEAEGDIDRTPSSDELHVGQYSARPGDEFQVTGRIAGLRIYHRILTEEEAALHAQARPDARMQARAD